MLSGSLLGTWPHIADKSSRSRLCRTSFHVVGKREPATCNQMKFHLSPAPRNTGPIRKGNFPSHKSLKRKRGVGEHPEFSQLGCLPRLRPLRPPISLPSNPSLALQASSIFASMVDLEVRVPNEVSA